MSNPNPNPIRYYSIKSIYITRFNPNPKNERQDSLELFGDMQDTISDVVSSEYK